MKSLTSTTSRTAIYVIVWGYVVISLFPLLVMLFNSLRSSSDIQTVPFGIPTQPTADNFMRAWVEGSFGTYFGNSLAVTAGAVVLGTAVSVLAAYPLARIRFRGSSLVMLYFLCGLILPVRYAILPLFFLMGNLGLVDSLFGLTLVYAATGVPFATFVMTAFFRQLPADLEDAGRVDGANDITIFSRIMLPLVRGGVATVAVLQFVPLWNDFFFPLILLRTQEKSTMPVGLTMFVGRYATDWGTLSAGLVILSLPLIVLFVLATRQIVAGLTAGIGR